MTLISCYFQLPAASANLLVLSGKWLMKFNDGDVCLMQTSNITTITSLLTIICLSLENNEDLSCEYSRAI